MEYINKLYTPEELSSMATDIAYSGKVGDADIMTVMRMLEQGAAAMRRLGADKSKIRSDLEIKRAITHAKLLYCMDYIMHHLSDETATVSWLQDGCPDGLFQESIEPPYANYYGLGLTDDEFEEHLSLFTRILARQVIPDIPDLSDFKSEKGALG